MRDTTTTKRAVKKRVPGPIERVGQDIAAGFGELKRQTGAAVENVKAGVRKIKESIKR